MLDSQGRIFGKINVIDFIVILLIAVIIVIAGIKLFTKEDVAVTNTYEEGDIVITFKVSNVVASVEDYISVGDKLLISDLFSDLEIDSFEFEPEVDENKKESDTKVKGFIKVIGKARRNKKGIYVSNSYFRVNSNINLFTSRFVTQAQIYHIEFTPNE